MQSPTISVIMPVYNTAKYLNEAIESILNQTFTNFELIIVNDCSTDNSKQIILQYNDDRIIYHENVKNQGLVYSLNFALNLAKGIFIARMDSDDISVSDRFQKQISFLFKNTHIDLVGSNYYRINSKGKTLNFINYPSCDVDIKFGLLFNSVLAHPSIMFRRRLIDLNLFLYNEDFFPAEDYYLWSTLITKIKIENIKEYLLYYRISNYQISHVFSDKQSNKANSIRVTYLLNMYPQFKSYRNSLLNFWNCKEICSNENVLDSLFVYNNIFMIENNYYLKNKISNLFHIFININFRRFPFIINEFKNSEIYKFYPYSLKERLKFYFMK